MKNIFASIGIIGYVVIGIVQFYAVYACFSVYWDWNGFGAFIMSCICAYMPLIGSVISIIGAVTIWDWGIWTAMTLFFFPSFFIFLGLMIGVELEKKFPTSDDNQ